jgi:penicillin-binding protein 2
VLAEDLPVRNVCVVIRDLYRLPQDDFVRWFHTVAAIVKDTPEGAAARVQGVLEDVEATIERRKRYIFGRGSPEDSRLAKEAMGEERLIRRREYRRPRVIYDDVDFEIAARVEVASADLEGLAVTESMKRKYPMRTLAAHAVGYVGEITPDEWDLYRFDYLGDERKRVTYNDMMGRAGVEKQYNFELRGARGKREEVVNAYDQTQKVLSDESPEPGATIILTIDPKLQAAAEKALAKILLLPEEPRGGAAVCMDVRNGEVLVLASSPSYDPDRIGDDYRKLIDPKGLGKFHPFQNKAVDAALPMGSTFKVITATAALESGAITRHTTFTCDGTFHLGRASFNCWTVAGRVPPHGTLDFIAGFQKSCNIYFFNAGLRTDGPRLLEWALGYGMGKPTGIDLMSEAKGNVPVPRYKGDVVNLSIGQGALLATPLQACRMIAAVANGGNLMVPRLRRETEPVEPKRVGFSATTLAALREGLYTVVNVRGGTGWGNVRSDLITIGGKTGTAQAPSQDGIDGDHAWFVGFAPFDDPQIAVAVVVEHGGHGGAVAGPVGKAIFEAYAIEKGIARVKPEDLKAKEEPQ